MFNLPKPKLGDVAAFTITSPDLDISVAYYTRLGFSELFRTDFPFPLAMITDGAIQIMLLKKKDPYIGFTYYVKELEKVVLELEAIGIEFIQKPKPSDVIKRFLMQSPDGLNIGLVTLVDGFTQPLGTTMLTMPPQDYSNPDKYVNKICGLFGEFAHPVEDLDKSKSFWEKLGFVALSKKSSPYQWAILSDGMAIIGLHQTNSFMQPTITFFASDMKEKIDRLKSHGLDNFSEKGSGNIVLTTPEQQKINLFRLGM